MSHSDATTLEMSFGSATAAVQELVQRLMRGGDGLDIDVQDMRTLISSATQLYAACSAQAGQELVPIDSTVSATDAVMLACALIRAHNLNPFDLALWYSRGAARESVSAYDNHSASGELS